MKVRFKRGAVLVALAALSVVMTASLASARSTEGSSSSAAARTLNIYGFGPGDDVANYRAAEATKALGSNVDVDNPRGGFNDQTFLARLAAGDLPDVVYLGRGAVGTWAAKGAFLPLQNCFRSENIDVNQYRKAALAETRYKGQTYGVPEFTQPITIIVNDAVLRQAGVSNAQVQTTKWKTLRQANKRLLEIKDGKVTRIGFDPKIPEFFPLWVKWFGKDLLSKDGLKAQLNSREAVAALNFTYSLIRDHGGWDRFKAFRDTWNFFGRDNQVAANQVGAWPMESWYYDVLIRNSPQVDLSAKFFTNRKGGPITMYSGAAWAIPRGAKDPDLACKWIKAMTSVETWVGAAKNRFDARKRSNLEFTGLQTANARADIRIFQDIIPKLGRGQWDQAVQRLYQSNRYAFTVPPSPASAEVRQAMIDAINRVLAGQQTPKQALDQAQREAQAAIDKNK